jgi:O-antigen/teichoic acid export membrane protein
VVNAPSHLQPATANSRNYDKELRRGALFNVLGVIAKLVQPLYVLSITWLWGPGTTGLYLLALSMVEIVFGGMTAGYTDATTIFASRHAEHAETDPEEKRAVFHVLSNTFSVTAGLALVAAVLFQLGAGPAVRRFFPDYGELLPGLYWLAWSLVPRAIGQVAISSTKAMLHMEHDALLNGFIHPLCMLAGCFVVYFAGGGLASLFAVQLVVDCAIAVMALQACHRYFPLEDIRAAIASFHFDRALLSFAVPQSFNLTFNRYIARLDQIMLASFGVSKTDLGYFGTAALLTSNLAQIRLVFSGALAPVVARHHARGDRAAFQSALAQVCRWTTSLVVPTILVCLVLRKDVLHLVSGSYGESSLFVAVLLIPPFTNCSYGMAGASLMFTGHSRVTLANSFSVAILNTLFTYFLIPRYGMLGAALSTAIATSMTTGLQMIELQKLEGVHIPWSAVWKPHAGLAAGLLALALVWDPVDLPLPFRLLTALGVVGGYCLLMIALRHEDAVGLLRRRSAA